MSDKPSGGSRIFGFREGDRSEYLALFGLTRFAFVVPTPRQEEFGVVDFLCTLVTMSCNVVLPTEPFLVQVKSNTEDIRWRKECSSWIIEHMASPLFVVVVDRSEHRLRLFTTNTLWSRIFLDPIPSPIRLTFDGRADSADYKSGEIVVPLGPPIIDVETTTLQDQPDESRDVLRKWIQIERRNLLSKSLGNIYYAKVSGWITNKPPPSPEYIGLSGPHNQKALEVAAPFLAALKRLEAATPSSRLD